MKLALSLISSNCSMSIFLNVIIILDSNSLTFDKKLTASRYQDRTLSYYIILYVNSLQHDNIYVLYNTNVLHEQCITLTRKCFFQWNTSKSQQALDANAPSLSEKQFNKNIQLFENACIFSTNKVSQYILNPK